MTHALPMPVTTLTNAQRSQLMNLVRRAAKAEIMPRFRQLSPDQIDTKSGPQDLVTEADRAAEAMITRGLLSSFPTALIVGEEYASQNPEILDKIAEAELCFTIDPVDGTWNFANGLACFGVLIAVLRFGQPVFGLLYDPVLNDFIVADSDGPAELVLPRRIRRPISVSKGGDIPQLSGFIPFYLLPESKRAEMGNAMTSFTRANSYRCACHEMRLLAQGSVDFALFAKLTPWDQPAGVVAVRAAGGHVAMLDGSEYNAAQRDGYLLAAANEPTWNRLRDTFSFLIDAPEKTDATDQDEKKPEPA